MTKRLNWHKFWENKSNEDLISSTGKTSTRKQDFFVYVSDIIKNLDGINKEDIILDIGGSTGYLTFCLSPLVKEIYSFDFSNKMVNKSNKLNQNNNNTYIYQDNIIFMKKTLAKKKVFSKIIIGSVLQYLENYNQIESVFKNLSKVSSKKTKILFTHNPEINKKKLFLKSYTKLNWPKKKILKSLDIEEKRLWLNFKKIKYIAKKCGFKEIRKLDISKFFFQSSHMFDFTIMK